MGSSVPLSVLMVDIDHFKNINDIEGHRAGDLILQSLAKLLSKKTRKADIVGRYGGEEFLIILPETNQTNALIEAERLRKSVESNEVKSGGKKIKVKISIGVAELNKNHKKPLELIVEADKNLYQAKRNGRNQVFPKPNATPLKK